MLSFPEEALGDGAGGIRRQVQERGGLRGRRRNYDGILHRPVLLQGLGHPGHGGFFLADGHVDADGAPRGFLVLLVYDRVYGDGGLARLPVAYDELPLAAAYRDHAVDGLDARLEGFPDGLALQHAGRYDFHGAPFFGVERPLAVDRVAQRVHHPAYKFGPHRDIHDAVGPAHAVALFDKRVVPHHHHAHVLALDVEHHAGDAALEVHQLADDGVIQAVDAGYAVAHLQDLARLGQLGLGHEILYPVLDDVCDLFGSYHGSAFLRLAYGCAVSGPMAFRRPLIWSFSISQACPLPCRQ